MGGSWPQDPDSGGWAGGSAGSATGGSFAGGTSGSFAGGTGGSFAGGTGGTSSAGGTAGTSSAGGTAGTSSAGGTTGMTVMDASVDSTPLPTAGTDKCSNAPAIPVRSNGPTKVRLRADMTAASKDLTPPCATSGKDIFFSFTLLRRSLVYADTFGATANTVLHFTSACTGGVPAEAGDRACNDNACEGMQSQAAAVLPLGTHYLVVSSPTETTGEILVNFEATVVSPRMQTPLPPGPSSLTGTTQGSGNVYLCESAGPENSYWWTTCPGFAGGTLMSSTCTATSFDTVLTLQVPRTGGIVCSNDTCGFQSMLNTTVPPGAGLNVLSVGGPTLQHSGSYTLQINRP